MTYKIIFIDEAPEELGRFQRYIGRKDTEGKFEVIPLEPIEDLNHFIQSILETDCDALITDYMLNEYKSCIGFSGVDLVEKIRSIKTEFPCFVLTSFDDDAVRNSEDVNIIYVKNLMNPDSEKEVKATFMERIENQIKHHRNKINKAREELCSLINKSQTEQLNAQEEERLMVLDTFIEKTINMSSHIPPQLKSKSALNTLYKMISNTDKLIEELKRDNLK